LKGKNELAETAIRLTTAKRHTTGGEEPTTVQTYSA